MAKPINSEGLTFEEWCAAAGVRSLVGRWKEDHSWLHNKELPSKHRQGVEERGRPSRSPGVVDSPPLRVAMPDLPKALQHLRATHPRPVRTSQPPHPRSSLRLLKPAAAPRARRVSDRGGDKWELVEHQRQTRHKTPENYVPSRSSCATVREVQNGKKPGCCAQLKRSSTAMALPPTI